MAWVFGGNRVRVKEESRVMLDLCLRRAESIGRAEFVKTDGRVSLEDTYRNDMLNFLIYLGYSDGRISKEEIKYINSLMGLQLYDKIIDERAERWDLKTERIMENPPLSLEPFVRSNVGPETGEISDKYYDLISLYITTFNYIGMDFIACNEETSNGELEALSSYINMLKEGVDLVNGKIQDYKPTIEFKPGSDVKLEEKPEYVTAEKPKDIDVFSDEDRIMKDKRDRKLNFGIGLNRDVYTHTDVKDSSKLEEKIPENSGRYSKFADEKEESKYVGKVIDVDKENSLEALMAELNSLTGMDSVKKEVNNLVNLLKICKIREEKGLKLPPTTNHLVFLGNPGTGKTTVARILSKIYHGLGILSKGHLVEVDRSGLVAGYMGQTGEKVMEVVEKAKGGVLFIDEAYALANNKAEGDFGQEAIDILNKAMEDFRDDLIVIAAGYHDEMQEFLDANPGLRSRFNRTIEFPNYSAEELVTIMCNRAEKLDYSLSDDALTFVRDKFEKVLSDTPDNFGNARSVRNYLDNAINNQANRLVHETNFEDEDELMLIKLEDIENVELT